MLRSALILLSAAACAAQAPLPIRGFPARQLPAQHAREQSLRALPESARMRGYAGRMAARPHHAGSPGSREVAEYALGLFRSWGLAAEIEVFEALLPYPEERLIELVEPVRFRARMEEPAIPEDPDSSDAGQLPTYNAYSADGDVTAPIVYVNYGLPEDYAELERLGVDVRGKIVLARYGRSWRGTKPKVAEEKGAAGCILFSDPREDGYYQGDVYPEGPFRPADGVQRGSVMDMPLHVGDPLSPGWASEPGSRRLPLGEARTIMRIPVLPVSAADAQPLLAQLKGPVAPESWRGALALTYHVGPGPGKVRLKVKSDWKIRPVYNVIARLAGSGSTPEWVLYGNHHDAWVNGAADPVTGAASVLETARSLSVLARTGWKPARTILFALWDAEEFGLIGSTEWAEKHAAELDRSAAVYLNTDSNSRGSISASASPSLTVFLKQALRDLKDPATLKSLLDDKTLRIGPLGAGSDYVAFSHHLGIPSLNLGFSGDPGGVYHSIYDTSAWYRRFSDGEFVYGRTLAQLMATLVLRMADAAVLPFEFGALAEATRAQLEEVAKLPGAKGRIELDGIAEQLNKLESLSVDYEGNLERFLTSARDPAPVNGILLRAERALTLPEGLSGRRWYKHQLAAPGLYTGYGAKPLPGIREAVEAGRWEDAASAARNVSLVLGRLNAELARAVRALR